MFIKDDIIFLILKKPTNALKAFTKQKFCHLYFFLGSHEYLKICTCLQTAHFFVYRLFLNVQTLFVYKNKPNQFLTNVSQFKTFALNLQRFFFSKLTSSHFGQDCVTMKKKPTVIQIKQLSLAKSANIISPIYWAHFDTESFFGWQS